MAPTVPPNCSLTTRSPSNQAALIALGVICGLLILVIFLLLALLVYIGRRYCAVEASARKRIKAHRAMLQGHSRPRNRRHHGAGRDPGVGGLEGNSSDSSRAYFASRLGSTRQREAHGAAFEYEVGQAGLERHVSRREGKTRPMAFPEVQFHDPRVALPSPTETTMPKAQVNRARKQEPTGCEEVEGVEDDGEVSVTRPSDVSSSLQVQTSEISCPAEMATRSGPKFSKGPKRVRK